MSQPCAFDLVPIAPSNLETLVTLLLNRSRTAPEYSRWKYERCDQNFHGLIAEIEGRPVGCFGVLPRVLRLPSGDFMECGWFADWYVEPEARELGIGRALLLGLQQGYDVIFGHPGPLRASGICLANGYQRIAFQSRRRFYFNQLQYERIRTYSLPKALFRLVRSRLNHSHDLLTQVGTARVLNSGFPERQALTSRYHFADTVDFGRWISNQPVTPGVTRTVGHWDSKGIVIDFMDDILKTGEVRRAVLYVDGELRFSFDAWQDFIDSSRSARCSFIELFTTEYELDATWRKLGAVRVPEGPIVVHGLSVPTTGLVINGWDRESWTNMSAYRLVNM